MKLFIIHGENNCEKTEIHIHEYLMVTDIKDKLDEILNVNLSCTKYYFRLVHKNIILFQNKSIKCYKICENDELWFGAIECYLKNDDIIVEVYHLGGIIQGGEYLIVKMNETILTIRSIIERLHSEVINIWNANGKQMENDQTVSDIDTNNNYKLIIRCDDGRGNEVYNTFDECCCYHDKSWMEEYLIFDQVRDDNKNESTRTILIDSINEMKQFFLTTHTDDDRLNEDLSEYPSSFIISKNLFAEDMTYSVVDILNDYSVTDILQDEDAEEIFSKYIQLSLRAAFWDYSNLRLSNESKTNKSMNDIIIDAFDHFLKYLNDYNNDWQYWMKLLMNRYLLKSFNDDLSEYVTEKMDESSINNFIFEIRMHGKTRYITIPCKPETVMEAKIIISNGFSVGMKHLYCIKPGGDHKPNDEDAFDNGFIIEVVLS